MPRGIGGRHDKNTVPPCRFWGETAARSPAQIDRSSAPEKISNDMPLFAHGDAARCHGSAPCKSPDLRSEGEEKSLLAYTSSLLTEQVPQWWTLAPAGDGASPASVCPCAHSAGRAGLCTPFISSRRLTLLRGPLQQNGYTVSMSQLKHSIVAFIVLEWRCKVNGFEGRGREKRRYTAEGTHRVLK